MTGAPEGREGQTNVYKTGNGRRDSAAPTVGANITNEGTNMKAKKTRTPSLFQNVSSSASFMSVEDVYVPYKKHVNL